MVIRIYWNHTTVNSDVIVLNKLQPIILISMKVLFVQRDEAVSPVQTKPFNCFSSSGAAPLTSRAVFSLQLKRLIVLAHTMSVWSSSRLHSALAQSRRWMQISAIKVSIERVLIKGLHSSLICMRITDGRVHNCCACTKDAVEKFPNCMLYDASESRCVHGRALSERHCWHRNHNGTKQRSGG